ncbi:MAG: EAL domain-containing protein [Thiohalomonadaceae bacterium]
MSRKELGSYIKYVAIALTVGLVAATLQQRLFFGTTDPRFYLVPITVFVLFGLLLAWISVLRQRLGREYEQQREIIAEHRWIMSLQQGVVEQLNQHQPLPTILSTLLRRLVERRPDLSAAILLLDGEDQGLQIAAVQGMDARLQQSLQALGRPEQQALLAYAERSENLHDIPGLQGLLEHTRGGACRCLPIEQAQHKHGLLLLCHQHGTGVSRDGLSYGDTIVQLAMLAIAQHRHEEALHSLNGNLSALVESIPDAIFFKDGAGRWLVTNQAAKRFFQLQGFSWQGRSDQEMAEDRPTYRQVYERCFGQDQQVWEQGELMVFEEQFPNEQGEMLTFEMRKMPVFEEDGRRKAMVVISRDITRRMAHEHELRIAAITFESQEGMMIADANGQILRANRALCEQTGYRPEEIVGQRVGLFRSGRHDAAFYQDMWTIIEADGFWQGEVWNRRKSGEIYPVWLTITAVEDRQGQRSHFVATYSDVTERKEAERQIRHLAFYDALTSLPNRRLLLDRLHQAMVTSQRNAMHGALLFIDLDNFKTLNDTQGHLAGDQLLIEVAQRLRECVREYDSVARLGGDEFVVLLEQLHLQSAMAARKAEQISEKILKRLNQPYHLREREHHSSPSIGVSLFHGQQESSEELLKRADMAMYQAKAAGRNTIRFFDPSMQASVEAKASMEADLRQALEVGQLSLHYQAQINDEGSIHGAEALLRWKHPQRGMVSPTEFIPLAEESALILSIGQWALRAACQQLQQWTGSELEQMPLAINISARQFRQPDFVDQVRQMLAEHQLAPQRIKLELTESMVLDDINDTIEKMRQLREHGCRFSLDDFGTGYSSLAYLRRLPLDELKIDQSFVQDIGIDSNDDAIVRAIIALATSLGLNTVAEGVESEQQRDFLRSHGCTAYQGYLFGRPLEQLAFRQGLQSG